MSNFIQDYWRELDDLQRIVGSDNEGTLSQAFARLLKDYAHEHKLIFAPQYQLHTKLGTSIRVDGVLIDRLRLVHGTWEAKDEKDNLDDEIAIKIDKGYPTDNIIFEDTRSAILIQNNTEVLRVSVRDKIALNTLLERFFSFCPPDVEIFEEATAKFRTELPQVIKALSDLINAEYIDNINFQSKFSEFFELCKRAIGDRVIPQHIIEMLIQHILTDQIFRDIFPTSEFHRENHLAKAISDLEVTFLKGETRHKLLARMEPYYAAIRRAASGMVTTTEKQDFLKGIYEDFYTAYNPKDSDRLGIIYTPVEVVRFIIEGCDWLAYQHFNKNLSDDGMDILDPCTGTGTFIVDLIDFLRGDKLSLGKKFNIEIHANEIAILPYYIACLNIEQTFADAYGQWREYKGACFVDTLDNWGFKQTYPGGQNDLFGGLTDENHTRILSQNTRRIPVIIGNPPYNANQKNENENNKNMASAIVDKRIKETYLAESNAQKTKLYDPYIRFFRWASDRIGKEGIIGFITNRSYLDSKQADGFRKTITKEFQEIWIIDLQSDVRKNPKISGTKHNIFGIQTGVAIAFLVRNPAKENCVIHYQSLDDFMTAIEKRRWLRTNKLYSLANGGNFLHITPSNRGDWLNLPQHDWSNWLPIANKETKLSKNKEQENAIFKLFSNGIVTARDEWLYDIDKENLRKKVSYFINTYEKDRIHWIEANCPKNPTSFFDDSIKWTLELIHNLQRGVQLVYNDNLIRPSLYRPYFILQTYYDRYITNRICQQNLIFPIRSTFNNLCIGFSGLSSSKPFQCLAMNLLPCLDVLEKTQVLPLYIYANDGSRTDNITDYGLRKFQQYYANETIEKLDIFNYIYAVLHDPTYREKFSLNLKIEYPRIPFYPNFKQWSDWGKLLIELHTNFEKTNGWQLHRVDNFSLNPHRQQLALSLDQHSKQENISFNFTDPKPILKADKQNNRIIIDEITVLEGIPPIAWKYKLGNRSALEWVLESYKEDVPKDLTIRDKFNNYRFSVYKENIIELIAKICTVSVETQKIIEQMVSLQKVK